MEVPIEENEPDDMIGDLMDMRRNTIDKRHAIYDFGIDFVQIIMIYVTLTAKVSNWSSSFQ